MPGLLDATSPVKNGGLATPADLEPCAGAPIGLLPRRGPKTTLAGI
jgi:hypothetical protein